MKKNKGSSDIHGIGRRKKSVARVWLKPGKGKILVNDIEHKRYFDTDIARTRVEFPLQVTSLKSKYDTFVNVCGGGMIGQSTAVSLGISRALLSVDENLKQILRKNGLLTVDSRVKERKKYGQKGARAKFQFVKR